MRDGLTKINEKLTSFKRKYYLNLFLRGTFLTLTLILFYFLIASLIEYNLWLSGWARFTIFLSFFLLVIFSFLKFLKEPFVWWLYRKGLGQEESAKLIGSYFPGIRDRLLNLIQLSINQKQTALLEAGIAQKSKQFENMTFENAIDLRENIRYLKYLLIPFALILLIFLINRGIFTQSAQRIVQFNREFSPTAPFRFVIQNKDLNAFFNEDFTFNLKLEGSTLPDAVYLISGAQRLKLETIKPGEFSYLFEKIQHEIPFQLEASGFYSDRFAIRMVNRPELTRIKIKLQFPRYLAKKEEELINSGNVEIPEGTKINWLISTTNTVKASMRFSSEEGMNSMQIIDNQLFTLGKDFRNPVQYWIDLENEHSKNKDKINYSILVMKDQYPQIEVDHLKDSVLFKTIFLGGSIRDDYGLTELALNYQITTDGKTRNKRIMIPLNRSSLQQSFFYQWNLDSLALLPGDKLDYYLQVWDNDGVNGRKSAKSQTFVFSLPGEDELKTNIARTQFAAESKIEESLTKAKDIREALDEAQQKFKGKQILDWQDKKMLDNLVEQKKSLDQIIKELQKQNELLEQKKDAFSIQNEKIREKAEQIQKLMDELLDPETRKLFEELEKLLKENSDMNQIQKMLDKMNRKEINLEKELERTLELFKQLQYDYKLDQAINEIREQKEKQEQLLERTKELMGEKLNEQDSGKKEGEKGDNEKQKDTQGKTNPETGKPNKEDKNNPSQFQNLDNQDLAKKQEELAKEFEDFEKKLGEIGKMAEDLKQENEMPSKEELDQVKDAQQESKESLEKGNPKNAVGPQKKSVNKMKQMQQQLEGMQNSMEMDVDMSNMETLRQIIHGLIKLSFDQEALMKDFALVQQTDPRYIQLSQNQLKIKDDSKVLEDSLLSLSKRDAFMGSVITKEVGELNGHLDRAADHIRERRKPNAGTEMQLSMTSINNLAIMLNDHYDMMMDMMANAMPSPGKKKGKQSKPSLVQLQQQLNQKIEELKNGNKSGRQYSEELAKMAAEQERIRRALQDMQEKLKQDGGKVLGNDIPGKMEQTEMDLVNKQITEQTIRRQKEIEVRLLEAEKSMREQNQDEERKGETAKDYDKEIPHAFEEYLRLKEKEVELLKTMPPKLYPYYKKEVNEYFKRIGNHN